MNDLIRYGFGEKLNKLTFNKMCMFWVHNQNSNPDIKYEDNKTIITYPFLISPKAIDPLHFEQTKEVQITKLY